MSPFVRTTQDENALGNQQHKQPTKTGVAASPRKPLAAIPPNIASPHKPDTNPVLGPPFEHKSPLKRTSGSILDDERGFSYLKRRRISGNTRLPAAYGESSGNVPSTNSTKPQWRPAHVAEVAPAREGTATTLSVASKIGAPQGHDGQNAPGPNAGQQTVGAHRKPLGEAARQLYDHDSTEEDDAKGSSSSSSSQHSFNSLINYDPSSQTTGMTPGLGQGSFRGGTSHARQGLPQNASSKDSGLVAERGGQLRAGAKATRAQALSARLRVAVYKVLTGQVHTPFARLRVFRGVQGWPCHGIIASATEQERRAGSGEASERPASSAEGTVVADEDTVTAV